MIKIIPDDKCMIDCPKLGRRIQENDCTRNCECFGGYFDSRQIICYCDEAGK